MAKLPDASGRLQDIESAPEFVRARRAHSAVESAINGLEVHGLDVCLDHGIAGFKRYVAWAVVAPIARVATRPRDANRCFMPNMMRQAH